MTEDPRPQVSMSGIEHLSWATKKKIVDDEVCVVTRIAFEIEANAEQMKILHNLLIGGGSLTVTFKSPQLIMDLELEETRRKAAEEK